jgi:hypothetical protein
VQIITVTDAGLGTGTSTGTDAGLGTGTSTGTDAGLGTDTFTRLAIRSYANVICLMLTSTASSCATTTHEIFLSPEEYLLARSVRVNEGKSPILR